LIASRFRFTPVMSCVGWCALVLSLWLAGGCASHRSAGVAGSSLPRADRSPSLDTVVEAVPVTNTSKLTNLRSLEAVDRELADAIEALAIEPSGRAHRRVAAEYLRLSIFDAAHDQYDRALKIDPRDAEAYDGIARLWRDAGFPSLGLRPAHQAIYYAPKWAQARNTLGTLLHALGDSVAAQQEFERALALDPAAAYVLNNLCYLSFARGDLSRAMKQCGEAVRLDVDLAAAHANLAAVTAALGKTP
jgi:tetratricopeptide (TPR) repeat protein